VIGTLLTAVLTAPLAPVRGVLWLAETLAAQAALSTGEEAVARRRLGEVAAAVAAGELDQEAAARLEDELLARLVPAAGSGWTVP
jgi:hypothetical protein